MRYWAATRINQQQLLVTLVLFVVSRTYSFLLPGTLGHYYVDLYRLEVFAGWGILLGRNRDG